MQYRFVLLLSGMLVLGAAAPAIAADAPAPGGTAQVAEVTPPAAAVRAARRHAAPSGPAAVDLTEITRRPAVASGPALIRLPRACDYLAPVDGKLVCVSAERSQR